MAVALRSPNGATDYYKFSFNGQGYSRIDLETNAQLRREIVEQDPVLAHRLYVIFSQSPLGHEIGEMFIDKYKDHLEWGASVTHIERDITNRTNEIYTAFTPVIEKLELFLLGVRSFEELEERTSKEIKINPLQGPRNLSKIRRERRRVPTIEEMGVLAKLGAVN